MQRNIFPRVTIQFVISSQHSAKKDNGAVRGIKYGQMKIILYVFKVYLKKSRELSKGSRKKKVIFLLARPLRKEPFFAASLNHILNTNN